MTALVLEHLNRSIYQIERNLEDAKEIDEDIGEMRLRVFVKNSKCIADANERLWDRVKYARKNTK